VKNVEANKVSGVMSRLLKNEEGNIIALFAAAVIPVVGLVGGGFDMSRIYLTQTRLQGACDAGALIGRKTMGLGTWAANSNARIILSSVEEVAAFNASAPRYRIRWQRCAGSATFYESNYGTKSTATSVTGIGPVGRQASPPPGGVLMFVELQYYFKPMIINGFSNLTDRTISQVASMVVRENCDTVGLTGSDGIYNDEKAPSPPVKAGTVNML
jgi:hypothetical protein